MIQDFAMFMFTLLGSVCMLFFLTYVTHRPVKRQPQETTKAGRHPYWFTLLLAAGYIVGMTTAYLIQYYTKPSPVETLGYLVFLLFLLISFLAVIFVFKLSNLERKLEKRATKE